MDRLIVDSARKWNFPPRWARVLFYLPPLLSLVLLATYFVDQNIVIELGREDGVLEWATVAFFVVGGVVALLCAGRFLRSQRRDFAVLYVIVGLLAIVVAGEEISWGQRIFGWQTPEAFADNRQGELNLHNLPQSPFIYSPHVASAYGAVAYLLTLIPPVRARLKREHDVFVPPFFLAMTFAVPVLWLTVRLLTSYTPFNSRYNEWCETLLAFGFILFVILVHKRLALPARTAVGVTAQQPALSEADA